MTSENNEKIGVKLPMTVLVFVFLAMSANWYFLQDNSDRGTYGDMFGVVNALFSGLAFGGVIIAILLQRAELKLQRLELQQTRKELHGQKEQMEQQTATLRKQNAENTFFQLLELHNDITNDIDLVSKTRVITKGRDCFRVFYERFSTIWAADNDRHRGDNEGDRINLTYLTYFQRNQSEFGHYFRSLYNIVKFVDGCDLQDKRLYTNLVRAQLSSNELLLLFYNCLSDVGRAKFKPLVEKYSLLKTLPSDKLLNIEHQNEYQKSAFE